MPRTLLLFALILAALPAAAQPTLRVQPYADGPASALNIARGPMQSLRLTLPVYRSVRVFAETGYADATSTLFSRGGVEIYQPVFPRVSARFHASLASGNLSRDFSRQYTLVEAGVGVGYAVEMGRFEIEPGVVARYDGVRFDAAQYSYRTGHRDRGWIGAEVRVGMALTRFARIEATPGLLVGTHHAGASRPFGSVAFVAGF